jgi:hypothetical protein
MLAAKPRIIEPADLPKLESALSEKVGEASEIPVRARAGRFVRSKLAAAPIVRGGAEFQV